MQLKPRKKEPSYKNIGSEFLTLQQAHEEYQAMIERSLIYPSNKFIHEKNRIEDSWKNRDPIIATCTKEIELIELTDAFKYVESQLVFQRVNIRAMFGKIYSYLNEIVHDNEVGWLTDEDYSSYLNNFHKLIRKNMELHLNSINQQQIQIISKLIAQN